VRHGVRISSPRPDVKDSFPSYVVYTTTHGI
jgi:hypothetical protein